jgi:nucleoside-diphosphate-sugar epimerase
MNVLVTGGTGYIGNNVVEELLNRGHAPVAFDMNYWGDQSLDPFKEKVKIIRGDCRNSKDVIYALEGIDAVLHLAGIVGEAACLKNLKAHFSINVESTRTLINCCTDPALDLTRDFIYASTCSVYGNVQGIYSEVTEESRPNPLSDYAYAKLRSENIILERGSEVPHFHPTVLRLSTVFGWSRRPRLDLVTNLFAYKAWKDKKISIFGSGNQYRSLIHVKDVARAFVDVLEAPRFMRDGKIFHVGEETNNKTVAEIAETVKSILPDTHIQYSSDHSSDRRDYSINCTKIKNTIGWKAHWSPEQGIREMIEKFKSPDYNWEEDRYRNSTFKYV